MTPPTTGEPDYSARIRRAEYLAAAHPFAAEVLRFYLRIAAFQQDLCLHLPLEWGSQPAAPPDGQLRSELNLVLLLPHFPAFLSLIEQTAPAPLAATARHLAAQCSATWIALLGDFWAFGGRPRSSESQQFDLSEEPLTEFILRGFLQPYAEFLVAHMPAPQLETMPRVCPHCGSLPVLGILRPEGDAGKRFLQCSFCSHEWGFRRILCPACGEEQEDKLPVYIAEQLPHIRVEACDTCKHFLRTVDLTRDGHAVPIVDDIAAVPLSLWAHEQGYTRLQPNLLGT
jgi:FdhE protein